MNQRVSFACALTLIVAGSASASSLTMTFSGFDGGRNIGLSYNSALNWNAARAESFALNAFTGARTFTDGIRNYHTFATQIAESMVAGDVISFDQVSVGNVPGGDPGKTPIGEFRASLLRDLYGRYWDFARVCTDPNFCAAFQLAVWEITHENITATTREEAGDQLSLDLGAFQSGYLGDPDAFEAYVAANLMLASLGNEPFFDFAALRGWVNSAGQDQLVVSVVPLPAPAIVAALGLLAARSRRRSR